MQVTLVKDERIDRLPLGGLNATVPHDPEKEVTLYRRPGHHPHR